MSSIRIDLPAEVLEAIQQVSAQMRVTSEEFVQMALSFFMQQNVAELAIIALERMEDSAKTFDYTNIQPSFELGFSIHPDAKEELELLNSEQQAELLESLFMKITEEDKNESEGTDLVLQEGDDFQLIYSRLAEIDIIYTLSEKNLTLYLLHPFIELDASNDILFLDDEENEENNMSEHFDNDPPSPYRNH